MRAYACGEIGTNTTITVPLVPPSVDPDGGPDQTEVAVFDPLRPETEPTEWIGFPVKGRNPTNPQWFVFDYTTDDAVPGTFDFGDPEAPGWLDTQLTNPEKNFLRQQYPEGDMDAVETYGDALRVLRPEFWAKLRRSARVGWAVV